MRIKKDLPLVSIIIPVYNAEKYLSECLDTVIKQTLKAIEVILIDDGSTDGSVSLCQRYVKSDPRIHIIQQANEGAAAARNNGLRYATGEFIAFMDSDDWYPNDEVLEVLYMKAKKHNALICGGGVDMYNNGIIDNSTEYYEFFAFEKEGIIKFVDYQFDHGFTRFIYSKELLDRNSITFPAYRLYEDPPFMVKAMIAAGKFYAVTNVTYCYRVGYKRVTYDTKKASNFLSGLNDVLTMASQNNLDKLFYLTLNRFDRTFLSLISPNITVENTSLFVLLLDMNNLVVAKTGHALKSVIMCFTMFGRWAARERNRTRFIMRIKLLGHPKTLLKVLENKLKVKTK